MSMDIAKGDKYVYIYDNNIYINLTNKCNNACTFCIRDIKDGIGDDRLWIQSEPSLDDIRAELVPIFDSNNNTSKPKGKPQYNKQVVFCGYGESTYRLETMLQVAELCHNAGYKTRLNTNGLGAHINNITSLELAWRLYSAIDSVSISLNAGNKLDYDKLVRPSFDNAFAMVIEFGSALKSIGMDTVFSVVDILDKSQMSEVKTLCKNMKIKLRIRPFIQ